MTASAPSLRGKAALLLQAKGDFEIRDVDITPPSKGEILIRAYASSIQPVEAKVYFMNIMNLEYPCILGSTTGGVVEAIGEDVTKVKVGDRVIAGTNTYPSKGIWKYGTYQQFVIADEFETTLIGDLDFKAAVAAASQAPTAALFLPSTLGMERPVDPQNPIPKNKKILIWGGSSATGYLSIGYAKQAGYTVITTCSAHNFDLVKGAGADFVFDYNDPATIEAIQDLFPIDFWFDCISLPASQTSIFKILEKKPSEESVAIQMLLPPGMIPGSPAFPENVSGRMTLYRNKAEENQEFAKWFLGKGGYLQQGLSGGWIKGVPAVSVGGLESVKNGIEQLHKGVSGKKIVIEPWVE